jgi:hypothetical protein
MLPIIEALIALALFVLPSAGGLLLTHLIDYEPPFLVRLAFAIVIGVVGVSLIAFALASVWGLSAISICSSVLASFLIPFIWTRKLHRRVVHDIYHCYLTAKSSLSSPTKQSLVAIALGFATMVFLAFVFWYGVFDRNRAIITRMQDNYANLALHMGITNGFVFGDNFPVEHPAMAGVKLTYPFIVDFHAALLVKLGLPLSTAFFLQNMFIAFALVTLFVWFARQLTQNQTAGWLALVLLFFNGGLGWTMLFREAQTTPGGLFALLANLPHDYSSSQNLYRFNNSLIHWFVPMRSMLLATPMLSAVWILWIETLRRWRAEPEKRQTRILAAAGAITGLMPLVHAHSYVALMASATILALVFRRWREWAVFMVIAAALAIPQIILVTAGGQVHADKFFSWEFGWGKRENNFLWYWFLNTGLFIPLLVIALIRLGRKDRLTRDSLLFFLPFILWFIVPNLLKLAPWIWDNIKVLYIWFLASVPFVAAVLVEGWQRGRKWRFAVVAVFVSLTLSGALDFYRLFTVIPDQEVYSRADLEFGDLIRMKTASKSLIMSAPVPTSHVLLTGRRLFVGYPGTIWTHGLSFEGYQEALFSVYQGRPDAEQVLKNRKIEYVLLTTKELNWAKDLHFTINTDFLNRFSYDEFIDPEFGQSYRLYSVKQ